MKIISRIFLPALLLVYIGAETWMKWQHTSLCSSSGCALAGELLRFDSIYLNYLGSVSVAAILILGIVSLRNTAAEILYFAALYGAVAFESILIGYQFFANPEPCIFCIGVYASLLLIALLSNWRYFLFALPAISAVFIALGSLTIPKNSALADIDGVYLIYSQKCPHCRKVRNFLSENSIRYTPLPITSPRSRYLAKILDIKEIPIAIIKHKGKRIEIFHGEKSIIESFEDQHIRPDAVPKKDDISHVTPSDLYSNPSEEGCSLSPAEKSGCQEPDGGIKLR